MSRWRKWLAGGGLFLGGAAFLGGLLHSLHTFNVIPALLELNPGAVEMWKTLLAFIVDIAWPLVVLAIAWLFAPQIRERINQLIKLKTPLGSGEFLDTAVTTAIEAGAIEEAAKKTADPIEAAKVDRRSEGLYGRINREVGVLGNAVLIRLDLIGETVTNTQLERGLSISRTELDQAHRRLYSNALVWKERPHGPARPTQVGRLYLHWLERARPNQYVEARDLWSDE